MSVTFGADIGGGGGLLTSVHIIERAQIRLDDRVVVPGATIGNIWSCYSSAILARITSRRYDAPARRVMRLHATPVGGMRPP